MKILNKIKSFISLHPKVFKSLFLIFGIFVIALVIHISDYAYSSFNLDSIPYDMFISSDSKNSLMFTSKTSLHYLFDGKALFMNYTIDNGHIIASLEEDEFINFYLVKNCIYDQTNNLMLFPIILE